MATLTNVTKDKLTRAQKVKMALTLRQRGCTYAEIAEAMQCSVGWVHKWVQREFNRINESLGEKAATVRTLETARLDYMLDQLQPGINRGETQSIGMALKIQERRAKLWGLDKQDKESSLEKALASLLSKPVEDIDESED